MLGWMAERGDARGQDGEGCRWPLGLSVGGGVRISLAPSEICSVC